MGKLISKWIAMPPHKSLNSAQMPYSALRKIPFVAKAGDDQKW
jgi:hypothetical protein